MDVGRDVRNDFFELHFVSELKEKHEWSVETEKKKFRNFFFSVSLFKFSCERNRQPTIKINIGLEVRFIYRLIPRKSSLPE
jgi:hypothetical protein